MSSPKLSQLELERQARIEANKRRMKEIGLAETVAAIATVQGEQARARRAAKAATRAAHKAARAAPSGRVRRWAGAWEAVGGLAGARAGRARPSVRGDCWCWQGGGGVVTVGGRWLAVAPV